VRPATKDEGDHTEDSLREEQEEAFSSGRTFDCKVRRKMNLTLVNRMESTEERCLM
jgi:hypothetical protein